MRYLHVLCLTAGLASIASPALAQSKNRFAIGGEFKIRATDRASKEDYARGRLGPGLLWRIGESKEGWKFHWGLNWYSADLERPIGGASTELGELKVRPVMVGYGYTKVIHHIAITSDVLAGYAIGSFGIAPGAVDAYRNRLGMLSVTAKASNTFVLKPEIGVWWDVSRKIGINVNAGYMVARPEITVTTALGAEKRGARADQFILKAGMVYSIF